MVSTDIAHAWQDRTKQPRERAEALVAAMPLEQHTVHVGTSSHDTPFQHRFTVAP
jgi:hypothetical protein